MALSSSVENTCSIKTLNLRFEGQTEKSDNKVWSLSFLSTSVLTIPKQQMFRAQVSIKQHVNVAKCSIKGARAQQETQGFQRPSETLLLWKKNKNTKERIMNLEVHAYVSAWHA